VKRSKYVQQALRLPYVTEVKRGLDQCEAYTPMSMKAYYDPVRKERYRCKHAGRYRFRALKSSWSRSGKYCWHHLVSQMMSMGEYERHVKWFDAHPEDTVE